MGLTQLFSLLLGHGAKEKKTQLKSKLQFAVSQNHEQTYDDPSASNPVDTHKSNPKIDPPSDLPPPP